MKRAAFIAVLTLGALSAGPVCAGDGQAKEPFELVRELQVLQDQSVLRSSASENERERIARIGAQLMQVPARNWSDPKNARAAVIYVLSGGDPRVLRKLIGSAASLGIDDRLVKAALAYGERRDGEAIKLFEEIDMDSIDQSIVGHVSLVRALLIADQDPAKALSLLGMARILASGTIVEEAALRREAILSAKSGNLDAFEALSSQYFRRFSGSKFAGNFRQLFAHEVVAGEYATDEGRLAKLSGMLHGLNEAEQRKACLAIAQEGVASGNVAMVRFVVRTETELFKGSPADATRLRLYDAAALVVTKDVEAGITALNSIDRSKLDPRELDLLRAALAVGREVTRLPRPRKTAALAASAQDVQSVSDDAPDHINPKEVTHAEEVLARVDKLLSEAVK